MARSCDAVVIKLEDHIGRQLSCIDDEHITVADTSGATPFFWHLQSKVVCQMNRLAANRGGPVEIEFIANDLHSVAHAKRLTIGDLARLSEQIQVCCRDIDRLIQG